MTEIRKTYCAGDLTVVWQPALCIHSEKCFHGLPAVFDPNRRPWIRVDAADAATIVVQVANCPSGALSIESAVPAPAPASTVPRVEILRDGPLVLHGRVMLVEADGKTTPREGATALCRCRASANKPYCDGSHKRIGFSG